MGILFTPLTVGSLTLKNRFVRSATYDGGADPGGFISEWQTALNTALAKSGVGLIVNGITNVDSVGKISPTQNRSTAIVTSMASHGWPGRSTNMVPDSRFNSFTPVGKHIVVRRRWDDVLSVLRSFRTIRILISKARARP